MVKAQTKYIFVTGGVISSLGKGITTASIAKVLQSKGHRVACVKCDMYVNIDAGTMRPTEHGEVFVTKDGVETDQDLGNYERFINVDTDWHNYVTTGQIYQEVIRKERNFEYEGEDVEVVPHVPEEIIRRIKLAGKVARANIVMIEIGGTVGEYQNILFLEADRMMKRDIPENVLNVHVSYLPIPQTAGEMKTKPVQNSVRTLNAAGIQPDFVVGRSERSLDKKRIEKIATFCNVKEEDVISNPDIESIYEIPLLFDEQKFGESILKKLKLGSERKKLNEWRKLIKKIKSVSREVKIGVVGKYFKTGDYDLEDSYISVIEAIKHASWANDVKPKIKWLDSEQFEKNPKNVNKLADLDGIIVPGGYGSRGIEGKINAIKFVRENNIPYLGLCYGMQLAVVEFARHVAGLKGANSTEINPRTKHPVIDVMEEQKKILEDKDYGGTNRLGAYPCAVRKDTFAYKAYKKERISERHRHRYEFNNKYRDKLIKKGLRIGGVYRQKNLVEIIEIPEHKWFVGSQFHPEFQSYPQSPHPLFRDFIQAAASK
ncbi:MAG: CTP synthase [bacterium]